ncbi:MAG: hypothetical protein Q4B75_06500 [Eubacteriales bacterium]|nr:hypothetical protein [Eubacteriales bacterium]
MKMRSRRKRKDRLFAFVVLTLGIAIVVSAFVLLFYVQKIEITGNEYTEDEVILEMIEKDRLSFNSVYDVVKFRFMDSEIPGSLRSVKVGMKNPWTLKVKVDEREIIGCFADGEERIYFDNEGIVVLKSEAVKEQIPCIEGISVKSAKLYKPLELDSKKMLKAVVSAAQQVKGYQLTPDRILYTDSGIELYFGEICVMLGTDVTAEKIAQITPILEKLNGQAGTLHLEHYGNGSDTITFKKVAEEEPDDTQEDDQASAEEYDDSGAYYDESDGYYDDTDYYEE